MPPRLGIGMLPLKVISLIRSAERREIFRSRNSHIDFEFFDAVDGSALSLTEIQASGLFEPGLPYSIGAYGVALSHLAQWDAIIASGQAHTVAEDDTVFRMDFAEQQARILQALPPDWDIILWGWNFNSDVIISPMRGMSPMLVQCNERQLRGALAHFQAVTDPPTPIRLAKVFGLPCYSMSPAGARKFRAGCFPLRNFEVSVLGLDHRIWNSGIDIAASVLYADSNAFVSLPPLVATPNDPGVSTVQNKAYFPGSPGGRG